MIDITLLGTGALLPTPERALASAHLKCGGHTILFDCGEGTQVAARRAGVSLMKTDLIALTHYHGDHIFGLPGLLQTMGTLGRAQPIYITGPAGLEENMAPILQLTGWIDFEVRLITIPGEGLKLTDLDSSWPNGAVLHTFPTVHAVTSQGYRFELDRARKFLPERAQELGIPRRLWSTLQRGQRAEDSGDFYEADDVLGPARPGLKVVFTGDTRACPSLVAGARDADLLIAEATYALDEHEAAAAQYGHMTFRRTAEVAAEANARRLWMCHFSQRIGDPAEHMDMVKEIYPGAEYGVDGKRISLTFDENR